MTTKVDKAWIIDLGIMTLMLGLLYLTLLGHRPLFVPDEGRYAEIAREMAENNDFITPYLNYIKYFEKPPFFYWIGALSIKCFGATIPAVRLINALFSIMGCLATYTIARLLYDRLTGLLSAAILATCGLYFVMGHTVSLDLPVTVFLSITLYAIMLAINEKEPRSSEQYLCIAACFAALAVLTKGLIGLILPGIIVSFYILMTRNWSLLRLFFSWRVIGIFLLIALPWHIAVSIQNPEFPYFYIVQQHFLRYSQVGIGHYQPAWFFIPWVILGFFPWVVFIANAVYFHATQFMNLYATRQNTLFLFSWVTTVFVFFSISKSKLIPYILPLFPALALLVGRYLSVVLQREPTNFPRLPLYFLSVFTAAITVGFTLYLKRTPLPDTFYASICLGIACGVLFYMLISCYLRRKSSLKAIIVLITSSALFWLTIILATPALDTRTIAPLAKHLSGILQPQDEVISYDRYYQDLPFYLKRRVTIVNWENELRFGMNHQDTRQWMISKNEFMNKIHDHDHRLYIIMNQEDWANLKDSLESKNIHVIKTTLNDVLLVQE